MNESDEQQVMAEGRFLRLVKRGRWEYVERHNTKGAVAVIALTPDNELVLVEQHRVPLGRDCIELPAGLAGDMDDDPEESFAQAARRELLEETGFKAEKIEHLFPAVTSPGLTNESIDLYRATGLTREHDGGGVGHESITVHLIAVSGVQAWLSAMAGRGLAIDIKVYAAAALAKQWVNPRDAGRKRA